MSVDFHMLASESRNLVAGEQIWKVVCFTELPIDVLHVAFSWGLEAFFFFGESCFRGRLGLYTSESQRFDSIDIKSHCNEQSLQRTVATRSGHCKEQSLQRTATAKKSHCNDFKVAGFQTCKTPRFLSSRLTKQMRVGLHI